MNSLAPAPCCLKLLLQCGQVNNNTLCFYDGVEHSLPVQKVLPFQPWKLVVWVNPRQVSLVFGIFNSNIMSNSTQSGQYICNALVLETPIPGIYIGIWKDIEKMTPFFNSESPHRVGSQH